MITTLGIIPAAGYGSRMGLPYSKELLPIHLYEGKLYTAIEMNIIQMANAGIEEIVVVLRPHKQAIASFLGPYRFGVHISYVLQNTQESKEGLPDAILAARRDAGNYVMLMGDSYFTDLTVASSLLFGLTVNRLATAAVGIWDTDQPERFGIVSYKHRTEYDAYPEIANITDKPLGLNYHTDWPMWGAVAFTPELWDYFPGKQTFSEVLDAAAQTEQLVCVRTPGSYYDIGTPESFTSTFLKVNGSHNG